MESPVGKFPTDNRNDLSSSSYGPDSKDKLDPIEICHFVTPARQKTLEAR